MNTTEPFRPEERQTAEAPLLTGSQALIESFLREGVETLFGYPGGAIIPVYDALYDYRDRLRHILVRHEQGAVHAAQGYARVSGRVGVCLVTSGPGATNTVTGLADALMDSTPLVLVTGQVGSTLLGTDAFQETNFVGITQAVTKWNCQVKYPEEIPAAIAKAFYIARLGRPGPVVVDITKDAQCATAPFRYERITDISQISRWLYPKTIQYILGLFIDLTGTSWNITLGLGGSVFDICVSNCRTNRIRIRILMSHYKYFLILHSHSSFQNSADLCTLFICKQSFLFRVYFSNTLYRRFSFWAIVLIVQICTLY